MNNHTGETMNSKLLRFGGIAGIITLFFIPAIVIQTQTGWFPENDLQAGTMINWLSAISADSALTLLGIGLFIIALLAFLPVGLTLNKIIPNDDWINTAAFSVHLLGVSLALAAFLFGFGFTWALTDLYKSAAGETEKLVVSATMGMRGFLVADDLATCLIGVGNGLFGFAGMKNKLLPNWLGWLGVVAGILVTIVLFRYIFPIFAIAAIGYPLVVIWFALAGTSLLKFSAKPIEAS